MTIGNVTRRAGPFLGNSVATEFAFTFRILSVDDVVVTLTDVATGEESTPGDYSVSMNVDQVSSPGGAVTYLPSGVPMASTHKLTISSGMAETQPASISNSGGVYLSVIERALDRATILIQQLSERVSRTLALPVSSDASSVMPDPEPGSALGWGPLGNIINYPLSVGTSLVTLATSAGASLIGWIQDTANAVLTTVSQKMRQRAHIFDLMTEAQIADVKARTMSISLRSVFANAAVDFRGRKVELAPGNYYIDSDEGTILLEEISFVGPGVHDGATATLDRGAIICIKGTTNRPFKFRRGAVITGCAVYYPDQVDSYTPIVYPPTLSADFTNGPVQFASFRNMVVYNAYRFLEIDDAAGNVGHVDVTKNVIYGIKSCIELTHNLEVIKVRNNNFTFGHWLAATEAGCRKFTRENGQVFVVKAKTDGFLFTGNMAYGYRDGVAFESTGICQLFIIAKNIFDQVRFAIVASGTGNVTGMQVGPNSFVSFNSQDTAAKGNAISITTSGNLASEIINISGANTFNGATEDAIYVSGNTPTRVINVTGGIFSGWAGYKAAGDYGAVNVNGNNTSLNVTGSYFAATNAFASGILGSCSAANIVGNTFLACKAAINAAYGSGAATGNVSYATSGSRSDFTSGLVQSGNTWDKPQSWLDTATAATYTVPVNVYTVIFNRAGNVAVTLPNAAAFPADKTLALRTVTGNTVTSASSNVVPLAGGAAGTAILPGVAGSWAFLKSDGTNWQIIAS